MKNQNLIIWIIPFIIITIINIMIIKFYDISKLIMVVSVIMFTITAIFLIIILFSFFRWYSYYMVLDKNKFISKVDRPRIFMISILLPLMMLVVYGMNNYQINNTFSGEWFKFNYWFDILFCIVFTFFFYTLCILFSFTLGKRFEKVYLPKVIKSVETIYEPYISFYLPNQLEDIFEGLLEHNFLKYDDFNEQNKHKELFINLIVSRKFPEYPFLYLNMDNLQTFVLHGLFEKGFKEFDLNDFWKFFRNKNKKATVETIVESHRKCIPENIKQRNKIELIFRQKG